MSHHINLLQADLVIIPSQTLEAADVRHESGVTDAISEQVWSDGTPNYSHTDSGDTGVYLLSDARRYLPHTQISKYGSMSVEQRVQITLSTLSSQYCAMYQSTRSLLLFMGSGGRIFRGRKDISMKSSLNS